ncbi:hypothetical protein N9N32_00305 [Alphaproteobacteria bacterium]|nr:hypothetical protein [Alphaproteobacteria bacterium]
MLKNFKTQREVAYQILSDVQNNFDPTAVIAGGAPRDWDLGLLASDIDLFIRVEVKQAVLSKYSHLLEIDENKYVGEIGGCLFEFLFTAREPKLIVLRFTPSISQIHYNGVNTVKTFLKERMDAKGLMLACNFDGYYEKIVKRFPEYKLILPEFYTINGQKMSSGYFLVSDKANSEVWYWLQHKTGKCLLENVSETDAKDFIRKSFMSDMGIDIYKT